MPTNGRTKVVIAGGGFGGIYTALELDKWLFRFPNVDVTLVNRDNFFLFTPMLHEVAASDLDITNIVNPVRKLVSDVEFFDGDVERVDLKARIVTVSHGDGHTHDLRQSVGNADEHADCDCNGNRNGNRYVNSDRHGNGNCNGKLHTGNGVADSCTVPGP